MNLVSHPDIHEELHKRWKELSLKPSEIMRDAKERGMNIDGPRLSVYKNMLKTGKTNGGLTFEQLTFLCIRYGIYININIGQPIITEGKLEWKVLPYNELDSIRRLNKAFPNLKKNG